MSLPFLRRQLPTRRGGAQAFHQSGPSRRDQAAQWRWPWMCAGKDGSDVPKEAVSTDRPVLRKPAGHRSALACATQVGGGELLGSLAGI